MLPAEAQAGHGRQVLSDVDGSRSDFGGRGAAVRRWLARHPRFHMHFTPTSASWLNMVERLFAEPTGKRPRRGVFRSIVELQTTIDRYLRDRNRAPKPFIWTKGADTIIRKYERARGSLSSRAGHWALFRSVQAAQYQYLCLSVFICG